MLNYKSALIVGAMTLATGFGAMAQGVDLRPENNRAFQSDRLQQQRDEWRGDTRGDWRDRDTIISSRQAVRIARQQGLTSVDSVRTNNAGYVIDGSDRNGDDIMVRVSRSGDVLDVRRD